MIIKSCGSGSMTICGGPGFCMKCSLEADQKKLDVMTPHEPQASWDADFRDWFARVTSANLNMATGHYDWNGLEDDVLDKCQSAFEAGRAAGAKEERDSWNKRIEAVMTQCRDSECMHCGQMACPKGEPLHFDDDGCPSCYFDELRSRKGGSLG